MRVRKVASILVCAVSILACRRHSATADAGATSSPIDAAVAATGSADASADAAAPSPYTYTWTAKYPDAVRMLGIERTTGTAFLVQSHGERRGPQTIVAVDLKTKKASTVAELKEIPRATQIETLHDDGTVKASAGDAGALSTSELQAELQALVGVLQRTGTLRTERASSSVDGKHMLFNAGDWMYRSFDGGRDLTRIDGRASYEPYVSRDGAMAAYEAMDPKTQKYGLQLLAMKPNEAPKGLRRSGEELRPRAWSADGRALFGLQAVGTEDHGGCAVRVDVASPPRAVRLKCADSKTERVQLLVAPGGAMAALVGAHNEGDTGAMEIEWITLPEGASAGRATIRGAVLPLECAITDAGRIACPCLLDNPTGKGGRDPGLVVVDARTGNHRARPTIGLTSVAWVDDHTLATAWVKDGGVLDVIDVDTP